MEYHKNVSLEDLFYIDDDGVIRCEEWRDIVGYENMYLVSNLSRVKSLQRIIPHKKSGFQIVREKILKPGDSGNGYLYVHLSNGLEKKNFKIYRLSAQAFIPNPENKPDINHKNGIKYDNRCLNLEWCTKKENSKHAYVIGLSIPPRGSSSNLSKLTDKQVLEIRENKDNLFHKELSVKYGLSMTCISYVVNFKTYKDVS